MSTKQGRMLNSSVESSVTIDDTPRSKLKGIASVSTGFPSDIYLAFTPSATALIITLDAQQLARLAVKVESQGEVEQVLK